MQEEWAAGKAGGEGAAEYGVSGTEAGRKKEWGMQKPEGAEGWIEFEKKKQILSGIWFIFQYVRGRKHCGSNRSSAAGGAGGVGESEWAKGRQTEVNVHLD